MKKLFLFLFMSITLLSCSKKQDKIIGTWRVDSQFYKATYIISSHNEKFYGKVVSYDDGTTQYDQKDGDQGYFLTNLVAKDNRYVNGLLHENRGGKPQHISISLLNNDTLEVTTTVMHRPIIEKWIRVQ